MWWLFACATALTDPTPYVDSERVLAVSVEPPEAEPGATVRLTALVADQSGARSDVELEWAFCGARRALAETGPVAETCLSVTSPDLLPVAPEGTNIGLVVDAVLPDDGCSLFGPNPPPPEEGGVAGRPADPDVTGGYYQPTLAFDPADRPTLVSPRLRCGLANVDQEIYVAWNQAYLDNTNPVVTLDGLPDTVAPGAAIPLTVSWPACEQAPCAGAEPYTIYDPDSETLTEAREGLSASWYTTGGVFELARNGRDDGGLSVENTWTAPDSAGERWLAVVVRDSRGGIGWASGTVTVE